MTETPNEDAAPLVAWSDTLSVGIAAFDDHHKIILRMLNDLAALNRQSAQTDALSALLDELLDYTTMHLAAEEVYFLQYGYPDAEAHIREHQTFAPRIHRMRAALQDGKTGETLDAMIRFLTQWLLNHIMETDKAYEPFFRSKGLSS